jgi:cupin fold WbuC family metalloprotein
MKTVTSAMLDELSGRAAEAARRRANHNLHPALSDPTQRLLNAVEPGSYVRPHRHTTPPRWEAFVALAGRAAVLLLDDAGTVTARTEIAPGGPVLAVEIEVAAWHSLVSLAPGTVLLELKPGPYSPVTDKDLATWAPAEGAPGAADLVAWLERARVGDTRPIG